MMATLDDGNEHGVLREPLTVYGKSRFTEEEYLEFENSSLERHEFYQGEIFQMSSAGNTHAILVKNMFGQLFKHLEGKPCQPYNQALRVRIRKNTLCTYPDISIVCYDISDDSAGQEKEKFVEPAVIVEVLSPNTRNYDQGDKFRLYRDIPDFREYILIDSSSLAVYTHTRNDSGFWLFKDFVKPEDELKIECIGFAINLNDLYTGTRLAMSADKR